MAKPVKNTDVENAETQAVETIEEQIAKEAKPQKNANRDIPAEVLACIGKKFIINEITKTASMLGSQVFDIAYENAVMSHGSKNVRAFLCTADNVAELNVILNKYKNGIIKS